MRAERFLSKVGEEFWSAPRRWPCGWQFPGGVLRRAPKEGWRYWCKRLAEQVRRRQEEPEALGERSAPFVRARERRLRRRLCRRRDIVARGASQLKKVL